jgi:hypothetical protein
VNLLLSKASFAVLLNLLELLAHVLIVTAISATVAFEATLF